jgi:hypothetical protein
MNTNVSITALMHENRTVICTKEAAYHLGRKPQTLLKWACYEAGPIRPIRINGRLGWSVADIKRVVSVGGAS